MRKFPTDEEIQNQGIFGYYPTLLRIMDLNQRLLIEQNQLKTLKTIFNTIQGNRTAIGLQRDCYHFLYELSKEPSNLLAIKTVGLPIIASSLKNLNSLGSYSRDPHRNAPIGIDLKIVLLRLTQRLISYRRFLEEDQVVIFHVDKEVLTVSRLHL